MDKDYYFIIIIIIIIIIITTYYLRKGMYCYLLMNKDFIINSRL